MINWKTIYCFGDWLIKLRHTCLSKKKHLLVNSTEGVLQVCPIRKQKWHVLLTHSLTDLSMEACSVVLTFESLNKILWCDHQLKPLRQYVCMVSFVFFNILQNEIWDFSWILIFHTLGSWMVNCALQCCFASADRSVPILGWQTISWKQQWQKTRYQENLRPFKKHSSKHFCTKVFLIENWNFARQRR